MPNGFKKYLPVWLLFFIGTIAVAWITPVERDNVFNVVYYCIITVFTVQLIISYFAFKNKDNAVSQATFIYSIIGLIMAFVVNWYCIYYNYAYWVKTKPWMLAIVNLVVIVLHYVFLIVVNTGLNKNVERDAHVKEATETMNSLTKEVKALYDSTNNEDIYRLYEALKYSDKASKNQEIENQIKESIEILKEDSDSLSMKEKVDKIIELIKKR